MLVFKLDDAEEQDEAHGEEVHETEEEEGGEGPVEENDLPLEIAVILHLQTDLEHLGQAVQGPKGRSVSQRMR